MAMAGKNKNYAVWAVLLCLFSEIITLLPTLLIVPNVGKTAYIAYFILAGALYAVDMVLVPIGMHSYNWRNKWEMKLMSTNSEEIKYAPSRSLMIINCLGMILFGIMGAVFNIVPLLLYLP